MKLLGLILVLIGVILIYDARKITKQMFKFGNQNEASMGFKMFGFLFSIGGGLIIYIFS